MFKRPIRLPSSRLVEEPTDGFSGMVENLSADLRPLSVPSSVVNLWLYDETGVLSTRKGTTQLGSDLGTTRAIGMIPVEKINTDGSVTRKLISGSGTTWKIYTDGGAWVNLSTGMTDGLNIEGCTFGNSYAVITNGTDNVKKYEFPASPSVSDLGGSPSKFKYVFSANNRLFGLGVLANPSTLYVSEVDDGEVWSGGDAGSRNISLGDGDYLTWGMLWNRMILLFKHRHVYQLQGLEEGYTLASGKWAHRLVSPIGTPAGRTVQPVGNMLCWLAKPEGIVAWTGGGVPTVISGGIQDTIDAINWASIHNACAGTIGPLYLLSVPTGQNIYPNMAIIWDTKNKALTTVTGWTPLAYAQFKIGSKIRTVFGDSAGKAWRIDA